MVCVRVREVITVGKTNVFFSLSDGGSEVFVSPLGANVGYVGEILVPFVSNNAKFLEAFA